MTTANFDALAQEVLLADTGKAVFDVLTEEILLADTGKANFDGLVQEILTTQFIPNFRRRSMPRGLLTR